MQQLQAIGFARAELLQHAVPGIGRVTERKARGRFAGEAARFEVVLAALRIFQLVPVKLSRPVEQREQTFGRRRLARAELLLVRHFEPDARGEILDRFDEAQVVVIHQEA